MTDQPRQTGDLDEEREILRLMQTDFWRAPARRRILQRQLREIRQEGRVYTVEVRAIGGWTRHSEHASLREAVDQADMVGGRVKNHLGQVLRRKS